MLKKVENYIRQWKMLEKGDKVVVGKFAVTHT